MATTKLYLYGASGHGKVILDILLLGKREVSGIIDDNPIAASLFGIPITAGHPRGDYEIIISIGNNATRKRIAVSLQAAYQTAVHTNSVISPYAQIGEGSVVMAGALINAAATIGRHCIINTGAVVEHDCKIANFAHIAPGAALAGNVSVGEGTHVGLNATVIQGVTLGRWATIGAGAVVINDVPDYAVVVGNPGRIIKYNPDEQF